MLVRPVMKRLFFPCKTKGKRLASLTRLIKIYTPEYVKYIGCIIYQILIKNYIQCNTSMLIDFVFMPCLLQVNLYLYVHILLPTYFYQLLHNIFMIIIYDLLS